EQGVDVEGCDDPALELGQDVLAGEATSRTGVDEARQSLDHHGPAQIGHVVDELVELWFRHRWLLRPRNGASVNFLYRMSAPRVTRHDPRWTTVRNCGCAAPGRA